MKTPTSALTWPLETDDDFSLMLSLDPSDDPGYAEWQAKRLQAAERLRAALCSVPFHAKKAEQARMDGDEMTYWCLLKDSEATLIRP